MTPYPGRTYRSLAAAAVAAALLVVHAAAQAPDNIARRIEEARHRAGAPGMSVAAVVGDRLAWAAGFGLADVEEQVPVTPDTVFRIASISKTFAATAVMQLVEKGLVSIDDPIQKYVPQFPQKGSSTITLRHILTHTSGIRHYRPGEMANPVAYGSIAGAIRIFKDDPLLFTPGTKYSYSTYAFNLLAGVVETTSGVTYEAYLREHIWGPAGMSATRLEHPSEIVPHRARQYERAGTNGDVRNAPYADLSVKWAGGGIISTAVDLAKYHIALDAGKLLRPETLAAMYTPATLADGTRIDYGLGWMVFTDAEGRRWVAHSGGATGGTTYLLRSPERKLAVVILCNVENAPDLKGLALWIADQLTAAPTQAFAAAARSSARSPARPR